MIGRTAAALIRTSAQPANLRLCLARHPRRPPTCFHQQHHTSSSFRRQRRSQRSTASQLKASISSDSLPERYVDICRNNGEENRTPSSSNRALWQSKYNQLMEASTLSLAPMMEYTDRHFRHLVRLQSKHTLLYTEMVAANAVAHERRDQIAAKENLIADADNVVDTQDNNPQGHYNTDYLQRFLGQSPLEQQGPSVLQLGGSDPQMLYEAAQAVYEMTHLDGACNYTAFNLNCGCPSPKVAGKGCFGAALMDQPKLVAELTTALHEGCRGTLPVTVKCRIGTDTARPWSQSRQQYENADDDELYHDLTRFIETVAGAGVVTDFAVHARIAVLSKSFSPADNRKIPPLQYDVVRRLVRDYSSTNSDGSGAGLTFTLNGGIHTMADAAEQLEQMPGLKGVMIGRSFAADPWSFAMADQVLYNDLEDSMIRNRWELLEQYGKHADAEEAKWDPVKIRRFIIKAVTPLFTGEPNAKRYRIALDEIAGLPKKLKSQGKSLADEPPLSQLILDAARTHLSEETLLRSPQESYERVLWEAEKQAQRQSVG